MGEKISRRGFLKSSIFAGAAIGLTISDITSLRASSRFDTIIKNGVIYNGELRAPVKGDVAIKNGRIAAIGDLGSSADNVIDAGGNAVTPGFIDIHTHTDANMMHAPLGESKIFQGVTLDIGGNCGDSPFPSKRWEDKGQFFSDYAKQKAGD